MAAAPSAFTEWIQRSGAVLSKALPQGYFAEFSPLAPTSAEYMIALKTRIPPLGPAPFRYRFPNPQIIGMVRYDVLTGEWWGTTSGPRTGWVPYPDLASLTTSICTAHRLGV